MRNRLALALVVTCAVSLGSGCAFTQMTDRAFLGSSDSPPNHPNRTTLATFVLPLAIVGDTITAPIQYLILLIGGDLSIYNLDENGFTKASPDPEAARVMTAAASTPFPASSN